MAESASLEANILVLRHQLNEPQVPPLRGTLASKAFL
jgi:hypothetical protein